MFDVDQLHFLQKMASAGNAAVPEDSRQRNAAEAVPLIQLDRDERLLQIFVSGFLVVAGCFVAFNLLRKGPSAYSEHLEFSKQLCMNAATSYGELIDWILSHVTDADMFIVQSAVTCGALFWFVTFLCAPP